MAGDDRGNFRIGALGSHTKKRALILVCPQNRLGSLCLRLVFFRWHEPLPTDRKSAAGLAAVIELINEFAGDIEGNRQGNHSRAGAIGGSRRIILDHTDPPLPVLCAEKPGACTRVSNHKRCASSDRSLVGRGTESAGDSHQFGNGFRLDRRNSVIKCRIAPRR